MGRIHDFFSRPLKPSKYTRAGSATGPAIVFVHGLSGTAKTTWEAMMQLCAEDPDLAAFGLSFYSYPTAILRLPFMPRMPKIRQLAQGLATELRTLHPQREQIALVTHSLGGIVARQYIVDELKAGRHPRITKLLLYAVPNTGSSLAEVGGWFSLHHFHLKQLRRDSDVLDILNHDWVTQGVEEKVSVRYVVGGIDKVVTPESAQLFFGQNNVSTLIGFNHRSIVAATGPEDIRYATLRNFLLPEKIQLPVSQIAPAAQQAKADPIFDIYTAKDEPFYVKRDIDRQLLAAMTAGHVWVSGPSGSGKTAALRRSALAAGWGLKNLVLGAYQGQDPTGLLRAIVVEFGEAIGQINIPARDAGVADLLAAFRRSARMLPGSNTSTILIEEIPLVNNAATREFLTLIQNLILAVETDESIASRLQLSFSSINDPGVALGTGMSKIRESLQFVGFGPWNEGDLKSLIVMLTPIIRPDLLPSDQESILRASHGSPRFVKMVFRYCRSGGSAGLNLSQLLDRVAAEQV